MKTYFVLLILTDGILHDMQETVKMIVEVSKLPCSVIIVGIGNDEFDMMIELDSDDKLLKARDNTRAKRDIVQFVRFKEAIARGNLAEEVLKEIPSQVCRYMEMVGYSPQQIQPDFNAINRTVGRQRDAMLARQQKKNLAKGIKMPEISASDALTLGDNLSVFAMSEPTQVGTLDQMSLKTAVVKKRRIEVEGKSKERKGKKKRSRSRRKDRGDADEKEGKRRRRSRKQKDIDSVQEADQGAGSESNALEKLASKDIKKAN